MSGLRAELVDLDDARDDLDRLAAASGNIFATWEFQSLWWRHFGRPGTSRTIALRDGERVVALAPLYLWRRRPLRVLRFAGHGAGDELGPVSAPEDRQRAQGVLVSHLAQSGGWDVLLGEQLPAAPAWPGARVLGREGSPVLPLAPGLSWDEQLSRWSPKLRRDLRGDERKLAAEHGLVFRLAEDPDRLEADLDVLFQLHEARWPDSEFALRRAFHRDFAAAARERGWLRLWFLELEGRPAAVWYGFRFGEVDSHYQVGRDPTWRKFGTGTLLTGHTIRCALADGQREYRFLRGGEDYKYRFATDDPGLQTLGLARGVAGRVALAAVALRRARKRAA